MTQTQALVLLTTLLLQSKWVVPQPADLGAFGSQNDIQPGVIYSFPSEVGRSHPSAEYYALAYINYTYERIDGHHVVYAHETAKYGEGPITSVTGPLVHVTNPKNKSDHMACSSDILGTLGGPLPEKGWIALIKRGDCKFDDKVARVYSKGAIGAIVYDFKEVPSLDKMKIDDKTRNITAVFTYKLVGEQLARIVDEERIDLKVSIAPGKYGKPPNINRTSVLFVSISFIVLMIISFVWLVFYYVQRFRYLQTKDRKSRQLCTVAKRVIAKIPTKSIKSEETTDNDNDCCAICIEPYKTTDVLRVLPCKHEFHKACIDPWLLEHRTCPMCKMDILKHYGFVFTGSQESILQLDMDVEDGDSNGSNLDHIRAHSNALRRHSVESTGSAAREFNAYHQYRQQLQAQSGAPDSSDASVERNVAVSKHHNPGIEASNITRDHLAPCELRQRAVSLPCTLRKKNSDSSCHGSNNCYVWALEIQQFAAKRNGETSTAGAIVNKCLSSSTKHDNDDIESLLLNEHTNQGESSASNQVSDQHDDEIDTPPTNPMINDGQCDRNTEEIQSKH
ncbi:E3 ubiquitin-protein ligase goliath isoform X2 [Sitodiplosis mosellana]|uniref:E3 ubiquitin-protein ligase goliath isoform X2 n=1 Tax=Sitodiplosis mosellana TaxID=263140 RepID=UPI002443FCB9|nr:E3 ubiquitin-protein ligase goliath isoform X2 [Sitodiplosis mosellana]